LHLGRKLLQHPNKNIRLITFELKQVSFFSGAEQGLGWSSHALTEKRQRSLVGKGTFSHASSQTRLTDGYPFALFSDKLLMICKNIK
jgi:hypothetical protein